MVQHAAGGNDIEAAVQTAEFQKIRLGIFDISDLHRQGLLFRVTQAGKTEIHSQDFRPGMTLRKQNRMMTGATAYDQYIELSLYPNAAITTERKVPLE